MKEKVFISYEETVEGMFDLIEQTKEYIKIKSNKNIIIIPYKKVNKIKMKKEENI